MTTLPEAKLYHTRRDEAVKPTQPDDKTDDAAVGVEVVRGAGKAADGKGQDESGALLLGGTETDDGFGDLSMFTEDKGAKAPAENAAEDDSAGLAAAIAAVKAENISARRLRIAERIAALHQVEAASPEEAVARLRQLGIDPFSREALRRAVAEEGARATKQPNRNALALAAGDAGLPQPRPGAQVPGPVRGKAPLPTEASSLLSEERRAAEIYRIQRDIAKRRRKRLGMLLARLSVFVLVPTIITGWYYLTQATPLYATHSQFQIQQSGGGSSGAEGLGALLGGAQMATNPESVAVQSYLTSRDAMLRLDRDMGFKRVFQSPSIDRLTRLDDDATNEAAYKTYKQSVKIGYDPTEGVINMEVVAPDPALSREFSLALIEYAEEQVDQMTARLRADQMKEARENYDDAENDVLDALRRVQELQQQMGILDPQAESSVIMGRISAMETEMTQKMLELGTLQSNPRPNESRVSALKGEIARLEEMISETRSGLTQTTELRNSLAEVSGELRVAEGQLETRQTMLASAAAQMEAARIEANKQVRYLSLSVAPVAPDEPTYPRAVQNTLVAFLLFSGIYLMISLTVSILREQVSS